MFVMLKALSPAGTINFSAESRSRTVAGSGGCAWPIRVLVRLIVDKGQNVVAGEAGLGDLSLKRLGRKHRPQLALFIRELAHTSLIRADLNIPFSVECHGVS
jgi:hypothetical protein